MIPHAPLIIDVAGTRLTKIDKKRLQHPLVGGVILFGRNWESRAQLAKLCKQIKKVRPIADLRRPRGRPRAALPHRRLHPPAAHARLRPRSGSMATAQETGAPRWCLQCRHRGRLCAGRRAARLRRGLQLHAGAGPRPWRQQRDWRPRLCARPARGHRAGAGADARLRQAACATAASISPATAYVKADSHVDIPVDDRAAGSHHGRRCRALWLAQTPA
jgi:beta-N-acetylhexosaminidase